MHSPVVPRPPATCTVLVIPGGEVYASDADYRAALATAVPSLERLRPSRDWKARLPDELGPAFDVFLGRPPCPSHATYTEWAQYVTQVLAQVEGPFLLVGHSLGAIFLAKYLSERRLPRPAVGTLLVALPYADQYGGLPVHSFVLDNQPPRLAQLVEQAGSLAFLLSADDPYDPERISARGIRGAFRDAPRPATPLVLELPDRGHFIGPDLPEATALLRGWAQWAHDVTAVPAAHPAGSAAL
jgi:predicted alpha/beta hydrolase family esterase